MTQTYGNRTPDTHERMPRRDQPELALRFYRRLLQMGVNNPELWCNLGLCCFYASQYDLSLSCLDKVTQD